MKSLCLASAFSAALVLTSFAVTALNAQSQIAFSSDRTSRYQIFTVAIAQGSVPTQVTTGGAGSQVSSEPDWSPSGTLAYEFGAPGVRGIHTINPNGTGDIQITPPGSGSYPCTDDTEPAWSPDASYIVYICQNSGTFAIWQHSETPPPQGGRHLKTRTSVVWVCLRSDADSGCTFESQKRSPYLRWLARSIPSSTRARPTSPLAFPGALS